MKRASKQVITKISLTALSLAMLCISCIFLIGMPKIITLVSIVIFSSLAVTIADTDPKKHETFFKMLFFALILSSVILIAFIILDKTKVLSKIQDTETLISLIRSTGSLGVIVFILLIIVEIIFLPIPGAVTAFIATKLYGSLLGCIYIIIGTLIGSIICFSLGKIFGKKLVSWMVGKEKSQEYSDLLNKKGRVIFIVMLLFPFFPDDILCLVAGMSTMSYRYFITVAVLTRPAMIVLMCYFAEGTIIPFSGWGVPVWIGIVAIVFVIFIIVGRMRKSLVSKNKAPQLILPANNESKK